MRNNLPLRGYAEKTADGSWFAICVDLNIYARGESAKEALKLLDELVLSYLHEAVEQDREHLRDLLPRPAPMRFWARYYLIWLVCKVRDGWRPDGEHHHGGIPYSKDVPLLPAV